jgi:hypothetical protein
VRRPVPLLAALLLGAALTSACAEDAAPSAPSAAERLTKARAQADRLTSFAFRSVTELPGKAALQRTVVSGRAAVPDKVAYTVSVGDRQVEVVRIGGAGYSRTLPGGTWAKEAGTAPAAAPVSVLTGVLEAADAPVDKGDVTFDGRVARMIEVTLTADEVRSTGLLDAAAGSDVTVTLALDLNDRVTRLAVEVPVQAGATTGALRQVTTYGSFGEADDITAPA